MFLERPYSAARQTQTRPGGLRQGTKQNGKTHIRTPSFKRLTSTLLLLTFTSLTLQPLQAAAQWQIAQGKAQQTAAPSDDEQVAKTLDGIKETAQRGAGKARKGQKTRDDAKTLRQQARQLDTLARKVDDAFTATEQDLIAKRLPPEILARHRAAVAEVKARQTEFKRQLKTLEDADDQNNEPRRASSVTDLSTWLEQNHKGKTHTKTDPRKLPFRTPEGKVRPPIETREGYQAKQALFGIQPVRLAGAIPTSGLNFGTSIAVNTPPDAADLAETEDIQLTPAIRAKALELGHHPVKIHNWVKNSIEYLPSYGSIQGADLTLQTKRGNAFDTASLEIALLRASGIPARYVYGTIQIPATQAMNWAGGVTTPEAALNILGQGGIPSIGQTTGGKITHIKLEHIWVEAWVDYVPSRGAVNREGDTWIPLDASFKQYAYAAGMDIQTAVPLDAANLLTQAQSGATVNEAEGWAQNLNQTNLQTALTNYQTQVKSYIDNQKPNATVGDVLGSKTIQQKHYSILMGTLQYPTLATGNRMSSLPDSLKWQYRTALYDNPTALALDDAPLASLSQNTASLGGKKITISFIPATQADTDLINSYLPKPHADGSPIQPSELPTSLPGYLLHLKAEIRVDGQLHSASTVTLSMGQELLQATAMYNPGAGQWEEGEPNKPIAGEYHAIALDLQGVSTSQLQSHKAKLEATRAKLQQFQQTPNDPTPINGLTKEDLSGDLLYTGILGYFASVDGSDNLAARSGKQVVNYRLPSYGAFMASAVPRYWYGIVKSVAFPGVMMDVDRLSYQVAAKDDDQQKQIAYLRQVGASGSAFEHAVPERLFADPNKPANDPSQPQGVSAVKAIAIAAAQGQRIYTLNARNQAYHAQALGLIQIDAEAKREIADALSAGKEVTVHQAEITVNGWAGSGYILLDPETGAGAYKISGGENGGVLEIEHNIVVALGITSASIITAYLGFAINYMASLAACYADEITATLAILALLFAIGAVVVLISSGGGAAPAIAAVALAMLAPQQASAAQNRDCMMDCKFASKAQLFSAGITPGTEEDFKEKGYGARPSSHYDICACKDGAIAIFRHGACGQMNSLWEVCWETWK